MAKVEILEDLYEKIEKKFGGNADKVFALIKSLEENPNKEKELGNVAGIVIKEIRYEGFRFYFITDGYKLKIMDESKLVDLLIKFVRMSDKKHQQKTIDEIKSILSKFGPGDLIK
ncbi:MAG: hypothetical protein PHH54_01765 [Candidatus Nanoarchaeia archaeon]|nr:hypothetical protein [Candidatus Nanoarchaeia archaeon]MDD5740689.1 hypothetical protein [Candidatus Nanoarchaeia archaeon]